MTVRCLIVDDNASFREAAADLLKRQGVSVVGDAATGAEAEQQVDELLPDVVLLDIDLGNETGFDVARRLSDIERQTRPVVILISTHDELEFAEQIGESPAVGFIPKTELSAERISAFL